MIYLKDNDKMDKNCSYDVEHGFIDGIRFLKLKLSQSDDYFRLTNVDAFLLNQVIYE